MFDQSQLPLLAAAHRPDNQCGANGSLAAPHFDHCAGVFGMRFPTISRRHFLGSAGIVCLAALKGVNESRSEEATTPPPQFLLEWGRQGEGDGEFSACVGIAIGTDDTVYTAEFRNERIQKFTSEGLFLGSFAVQPHAGGLAVDAEGNVYVGHWNSNKVAAYSPAGKLLREWGAKGSGDGEFQLPGSVALGPDGLLYVPDQGNSRIQVFGRDGKFVRKWGERGAEPGQFGGSQPIGGRFAGPQFVAFDRAGNVYATDAALDRIQKFTPDGRLLAHWGSESVEPGGFGPPPANKDGTPGMGGPIALCVDRQDRVWVSSTNNRVQQFSNDGTYLRGVGGQGDQPGQFHLPHGVALDSRECLYVADTMNRRIQKFAT
jgi:sugar lactone lactonase YvrE